MSATRPLVVVVSAAQAPAWQRAVLAQLQALSAVEVVGVRVGRAERGGARLRLIRRVEGRLFGRAADALEAGPVELREAPGGGEPPLTVHLDGEPGPAGDALWIAHGSAGQTLDERCAEAMAGDEEGVASEIRLRRDGLTHVVATTVSGVRPYALTIAPDQIRWKLVGTVARAVERLPGEGVPPGRSSPPAGRARPLWLPLRWARALTIRLRLRRPWRLRVRAAGPALREGWTAGSLVGERPGHLYADPFLLERGGSVHLFCEEVPRDGCLGVISHVDLARPGAVPEPVLTARHHLSYPFLLEHEDEVLMVPETASVRRVELWRATAFPKDWELDCVLLENVALADATLLEHEGRWWLWGTVAEPGGSLLDELHLFMAPGLRGPWEAHPVNPVVSDVRCARPAGPILRHEGRLVRPAQDGSRRYGGALVLREITTLTPEDYAERPLARLGPEDVPGARAVHHYSRAAGYEAIDVRIREPRRAR